ncbi:MAG: hypothetical protein Kow0047_15770 [Anaerolineae bacterium]
MLHGFLLSASHTLQWIALILGLIGALRTGLAWQRRASIWPFDLAMALTYVVVLVLILGTELSLLLGRATAQLPLTPSAAALPLLATLIAYWGYRQARRATSAPDLYRWQLIAYLVPWAIIALRMWTLA